MKADTFNIIQRLFDTSQMILKIPVYQRNYDWTEGNVRRLLEDVENVIKNKQQYFIGAIVYMESDNNDLGMPEFLIIDGQQRITTLTILLQALKDLCVQSDQQVLEMIDSLLTNKYSSDEYKIKLKPIKSDNIQYERLLNGNLDDMDYNGHIYKNYKIAKNIFSNWINNGIKPIEILLALKKLQVVGISLKSGEDDPQIIFESINSTGVALTNTDLIRNFLLMGDQDQDKLFEEYWLPIENKLRKNNNNETLDLFFRQYVITKSNSTITERKVYSSFINLFRVNNFTHESQLKELNMYANIYATFLYPNNSNYNDKIKGYLLDLKQLKQSTCYPFLMHVFKDYENKIIDEETLSKVLSLITIYLIRRSICNVPTNSLNTLFAYLYVRVFKVTNNKNKYYESINKYLFSQKNKDEIPYDKFNEKLIKADTLEELAEKTGVDANGLKEQVEMFNRFVENGHDDQFGRDVKSMAKFAEDGPFYAIKMAYNVLNTQGGPERNTKAEILDVNDKPIPHLYGAGELGGINANQYQGGGNLAECLIFGKIAGEQAANVTDEVTDEASDKYNGINELADGDKVKDIKLDKDQYIGESNAGIGGKLVVRVTYDNGIKNVEIVQDHESEDVGKQALKVIPERIVKENTPDVDAVSGASATSRAISEAVRKALKNVKE